MLRQARYTESEIAFHSLRHYGAVTQGTTAEDALRNINEVVQMIVDELLEEGIELPTASGEDVEVFEETRVAVTV